MVINYSGVFAMICGIGLIFKSMLDYFKLLKELQTKVNNEKVFGNLVFKLCTTFMVVFLVGYGVYLYTYLVSFRNLTTKEYLLIDSILFFGSIFLFVMVRIQLHSINTITTKLKEVAKIESLENELRVSELASKAKDDFLSKMSHELRTPLNAITGMINIIEKSEDIEKVHTSMQKMKDASNNLLQIINDVLDFSKIEAGKMELLNCNFHVEKMFREIFDIIDLAAHEKQIDIELNIVNNNHKCLFGDVKRLSQVYMNLLSNAIKFTEPGGKITISVKYVEHGNNKVELISSVTDTGVGIPDDKIDFLFHSFTQVDNSLSRQYAGTGLGLVITKNIVELMGGTISVSSHQNIGTTFEFNMFFDKCIDTEESKELSVLPDIFNILIIDNCEETCNFLHELFSIRKIKHQIARSAEEGIFLVQQTEQSGNKFNVLLINYNMPNTDGLEIAKNIRNTTNIGTIIIMASSIDWLQIEQDAKSLGINSFIPKPMLPSDVINSINELYKKKNIGHVNKQIETFDFSGKTILLFEDVDINREIVQFILQDTGARCIEAIDGLEGVNLYNQNPENYDLILMDIQMPNMDGFEATKTIRESDKPNAKTIPIIAMTANVFVSQIQDTFDAGMNSHIGKPIDELEMKRELAKFLNK